MTATASTHANEGHADDAQANDARANDARSKDSHANDARANEGRAVEFAAAVRERLSDLPTDELDELLDGLHADLMDRLADGGDLGDAGAYADELRQAAGLPARDEATAKQRRRVREAIADRMSGFEARGRAFWEATPARRGIRDFVVALRPVWWVLRGFGMAWVVLAFLSGLLGFWWFDFYSANFISLPLMLFVLVFVVLSVQWGRGRWAGKRWLVWLRRAASVVAVIALIPASAIISDRLAPQYYDDPEPYYSSGLTYDDEQIGNIFAYDCTGQPLDGVQLFTRDGRPLTTLQDGTPPSFYDESSESEYRYVRNPLAALPNGWSGWNVFPLQQALGYDPGFPDDFAEEDADAQPAPPPFEQVPAISDDCLVTGAAADADASPGDTEETDAEQTEDGKDAERTDAGADPAAEQSDAGEARRADGAAGSDAKEQ